MCKSPFVQVALVLVGAISAVAGTDESAERIVIRANWDVGEEVTLINERIYEKQTKGSAPTRGHTRCPATIRVLDKSDDGYRLRVEYGKSEFIPPNPEAAKAVEDFPQLPLIIRLSHDGTITSLENWETVRDTTLKLLREKLITDGQADDDTRFRIDKAGEIFDTHDKATALMTRGIAMYFYPIGIEVNAGEPLDSTGAIMNPLGGDPLPNKTRLVAERVPGAEGRYRVTVQTRFDEEAGHILQESVKAWIKEQANNPPPVTTFSIADESEFIFDEARGWVIEGSFTRTFVTDDSREIDRRMWRLETP